MGSHLLSHLCLPGRGHTCGLPGGSPGALLASQGCGRGWGHASWPELPVASMCVSVKALSASWHFGSSAATPALGTPPPGVVTFHWRPDCRLGGRHLEMLPCLPRGTCVFAELMQCPQVLLLRGPWCQAGGVGGLLTGGLWRHGGSGWSPSLLSRAVLTNSLSRRY